MFCLSTQIENPTKSEFGTKTDTDSKLRKKLLQVRSGETIFISFEI